MSRMKHAKLDYLSDEEIFGFYELFFGKILIKKPDFSYYSNLSNCLSKEGFVQNILNKLNDNELNILKLLSQNILIPFDFLVEKLNIILNIPSAVINRFLTNLIERKYIFLRDESILVVPDVYFPKTINNVNYSLEEEDEHKEYSSKVLVDINNLINYLVSKELKFSNSFTLYKKDLRELESVFSRYSSLKEVGYNLTTYFFSLAFTDGEGVIFYENIKNYFKLSPLEKIFFFIKITMPWAYPVFKYLYGSKTKGHVIIDLDEFKELWLYSFLLTEYDFQPCKINLNNTLKFLEKAGLIKINKKEITFLIYNREFNPTKDEVRLSTNFNFYINADSMRENFYMPALFSDFVRYNKIVEYEITEFSIKRSVINGITIDDVLNYLNNFNIKISKNVETTINQWFDQHASYFYSSGTIFFCKNVNKGKIINSLIKNDMIKAYEIKKDEVFLIPEENKESFFSFLEKSGINFYYKKPRRLPEKKERKILDISHFLKNIDR